MSAHFGDRLLEAVERTRAPAVVALDPVFDQLPDPLRHGRESTEAQLQAIGEFGRVIIEITAPIVPVVKINSAYFERYQADGLRVYGRLVAEARRAGLLIIGDVKRGDVGHTAAMYAAGHLDQSEESPDAITVSAYFGADGLRPFVDRAAKLGKGVFALVRTSNPSAEELQDAKLADGRKYHEMVAQQIARLAEEPPMLGRCGFSILGAVAATRDATDARRLRGLLPQSILLVPGYGAQGGAAADFLPHFHDDGRGAIVAAGRSVIFAYREPTRCPGAGDWKDAVRDAAVEMVDALRAALGFR